MRQIQYKLPNVILTEIPERQLRKDTDVKVRIACAAVCGRIREKRYKQGLEGRG